MEGLGKGFGGSFPFQRLHSTGRAGFILGHGNFVWLRSFFSHLITLCNEGVRITVYCMHAWVFQGNHLRPRNHKYQNQARKHQIPGVTVSLFPMSSCLATPLKYTNNPRVKSGQSSPPLIGLSVFPATSSRQVCQRPHGCFSSRWLGKRENGASISVSSRCLVCILAQVLDFVVSLIIAEYCHFVVVGKM